MKGENHRKLLYLIFGGLSFYVNTGCYAITLLMVDSLQANVISWVIAVIFVYLTNRRWVFESNEETAYGIALEILRFAIGRVGTLFAEEFMLYWFIIIQGWNEIIVKLLAQIAVIVMNYVISKRYIFREELIRSENDS